MYASSAIDDDHRGFVHTTARLLARVNNVKEDEVCLRH
jgi:type IV secretory pathway protease TraF